MCGLTGAESCPPRSSSNIGCSPFSRSIPAFLAVVASSEDDCFDSVQAASCNQDSDNMKGNCRTTCRSQFAGVKCDLLRSSDADVANDHPPDRFAGFAEGAAVRRRARKVSKEGRCCQT